ncbi:MAG: polysaccharide deacetylase family protein [Proteobacteria bacterium]|nr:polysaccharide deacetylase family protein [Pseudomonadota bacterium]
MSATAVSRTLAGVLALLLSACAAPPPAPPAAVAAATTLRMRGDVVARNDRYVLYAPTAEDTWRTIAARLLGDADRAWRVADFNRQLTGSAALDGASLVAVPLQPLDPIGVYADRVQTVPILCYHRFGAGSSKMVVSQAQLAAQLDWLARNDYRVIPLVELQGFLAGREALPARSVVITVDDGYESFYRIAWPLLRARDFPATLFVYTDFIGSKEALSWAQLKELAASGLVDVQAHSKSHRNLIERAADEDDASYRRAIDAETRIPREQIERRVGGSVSAYAYPFGDTNETVLAALDRQQFRLAATVTPGGNAFYAPPMLLRRTMIFGDYDLETFKAKLQTSRSLDAR